MPDLAPLRSVLPTTPDELLGVINSTAILGEDYVDLLKRTCECFYGPHGASVLQHCEVLLDMAWEKLNTGYWKDVDVNWRYAYTVSSLMKVYCQCLLLNEQKGDVSLADIMKSCDMGLLMGAPMLDNILARVSSLIQSIFNPPGKQHCVDTVPEPKRMKIADVRINKDRCVSQCSCPSLQTFKESYMDKQQAVIVTDAMDFWPALSFRKWDLAYIKQKAGYRTVPIELGSKYTEESWSQSLMTITEFIEHYIENPTQETKGYLAQHQLFDQIPELQKDISVPTYCCLGHKDEVDTNAWFGPAGTVSPLHYDPKHNLLAQVVGYKYIRLYSDKVTDQLYPHPDRLLVNTSQVDLEEPDHVKFPLFAKAPYVECVLGPGEMLYIPPKHWHFVKSLSVSFSVSFWWE
ncbi:bifunctional peptidase and arginyl-hydroxylase JMJD5-like [Haliotis asinina]|uniref:bifunctional peptidase and arginyl-hydroxylase JMJD5-like n=1 Tax=Haliotis asinina TaxID=109174 RepID=UPI0035322902